MMEKNMDFRNFTKLKRTGISLIVLVITIIVIIILSTAVILTISSNNPIDEANTARYESDVDSMQAIFTNTVAKVMVKNRANIKVTAGRINNVTSEEHESTGVVEYTVIDIVNLVNNTGTIVFDKGENTDTVFYTGKKLPIYNAGDTKWYVDEEGNISLEVDDKQYGGKVSEAIKVFEEPTKYYGKIVTNYTTGNSTLDEEIDWQIFYSNGKNIYLIATDYVSVSNLPKAKKTNANGTVTEYAVNQNGSLNNIVNSGIYTGSENINVATIQSLNSNYHKYLKSSQKISENNNMKAIAYMLDTNLWKDFAGENAEYAIGGPTLEMLTESYSQKYGVDYSTRVTSEIGYEISSDGGNNWANVVRGMLDTSDTQYVTRNSNGRLGFWLASPCAASSDGIASIYYDGNVDYGNYTSTSLAFRPLICLKSNVSLDAKDDGFEIK